MPRSGACAQGVEPRDGGARVFERGLRPPEQKLHGGDVG
jgi:hypothetical protein